MTLATDGAVVLSPRLSVERLCGALLWLMGCAGAFVFIEPSPYEVIGCVTIFVFALAGLSLRPAVAPLVLLLVFLNIGYAVALLQVQGDQPKTTNWVLISVFLATTAVFYAGALTRNTPARLDLILRGTTAAAVIASIAAIGGYFHLFGGASELFVLYERGRGTFNDPNVLGAFLVLPALLLVQRVISARAGGMIRSGLVLMVLLGGLFLTFSRAAWGQFAFCALAVMALSFVSARSANQRARIVLLAIAGVVLVVVLVAVLLSIGKIEQLFEQRASLEQSYDVGRYGRFGRYSMGAQLALERPLGIGPLQFSSIFTEDPHNTFLNAFMSGGWLGGFSYLTLTLVTLVNGLRFVLVATPWRSAYQAIYVAFVGTAVESAIIDIDHWRHYFLVVGLLWGLMAASQAWLRQDALDERADFIAP